MTSREISAVKTSAVINLLAGIWLFISPWAYKAYTPHSAWNSWIVGALIVIFGAIRVSKPLSTAGLSLIHLILGIWTFASPWIYSYTSATGRFVNNLIIGVIVLVLGAIGWSIGHRTPHPPQATT